MKKIFDNIKIGDKIYTISLRDSKIHEFPKGTALRELKVELVCEFPNYLYISLSDGITTLRAKKNDSYYINKKGEDNVILSVDVFATTKTECKEITNNIIYERKKEIEKIREKCIRTNLQLNETSTKIAIINTDEDEENDIDKPIEEITNEQLEKIACMELA